MSTTVSHATAVLWFGQSAIVLLTQALLMLQPDWVEWYASLRTSALSPSNGVFGFVWLVIYSLFATSGYLAFHDLSTSNTALYWGGIFSYEILLLTFAAWPFVFFHLRLIDYSMILITISLLLSVGCTVIAFLLDKVAGGLFVVIPVWLVYATFLNLYVAIANHSDNVSDKSGTRQLVPVKEGKEELGAGGIEMTRVVS